MKEMILEHILDQLLTIPGIVDAMPLSREILEEAYLIEEKLNSNNEKVIPVINDGIHEALSLEQSIIILKNKEFRSAGSPTFFLVENDRLTDSALRYHSDSHMKSNIVGEEIMENTELTDDSKILMKSILYYPEKRKSSETPVVIWQPSLPFEELESVKEDLGIDCIKSISAPPAVDVFLRTKLKMEISQDKATLIVSFNYI